MAEMSVKPTGPIIFVGKVGKTKVLDYHYHRLASQQRNVEIRQQC